MGKLILHPPAGARLAFDKDEVSVGRDPQNDFVIPDGSVSRRHARLLRRGAGWAVVDQGSANGSFVDSHRVADAALRPGQELRFGVMAFRVEIESDSGEMASTLGLDSGATVVEAVPLAPPPPPLASPPVASPATLPPPPAPFAAPPLPPPASRPAGRSGVGAPMAPPAAGPAKTGKGPLFWIGLGCGGCLTLLLGFFALLGGGLYFMASGPVDAVKAHVRLLSDGQAEAAYGQLTEEYRQQVSPQEYAALVAAHPGLSDNAEVQTWPPNVNRVNERARVSVQLLSKSGVREQLTCELRQLDGDWRIASLAVETRR